MTEFSPFSSSDTAFPLEEARGLILGRDVSVYYGHNRVRAKLKHHHEQAQLVLTYEHAVAEISWMKGHEPRKEILREHSFCLIPPRVQHCCRWKPQAELVILYLEKHFFLQHVPMMPSDVLMASFRNLCRQDPVLWPLAEDLRALVKKSDAVTSASVASIGAALAARTLESHFQAGLVASEPAHVPLPESMLRKVSDYIETHLNGVLDGSVLAKTVGLSSDHFRRLFKRATGSTPTQYVAKARTQKALELLRSGDFRVSEAALQVGFSDQSHFNRYCRRFFGCPPRAVLKRVHKVS